MKVALECAAANGLPAVATMSFRPLITECTDGHTPEECARVMADLGAIAVGANCEQDLNECCLRCATCVLPSKYRSPPNPLPSGPLINAIHLPANRLSRMISRPSKSRDVTLRSSPNPPASRVSATLVGAVVAMPLTSGPSLMD